MNTTYAGHNLVFIVGSPRSGTTWLQRLLAVHPSVHTGQESKIFRSYIYPLLKAWRFEQLRETDPSTATGRGVTGMSCYLSEEEFLANVKEFLVRMMDPMVGSLKPGEVFVEKTPGHALCVPEMHQFLPASRIIHLLRDARDVTASLLSAGRSWGTGWAPRGAGTAAATWVKHVTRTRTAAAGLDSDRFLELRYEHLWHAPEQVLRQVGQFIGLEWSDADIQAAIAANTGEAARADGGTPIPVRGKAAQASGHGVVVEPATFVRRASPGGWKQDLTAWEKFRVWWIARHLMREVGDEWSFPWPILRSGPPPPVLRRTST